MTVVNCFSVHSHIATGKLSALHHGIFHIAHFMQTVHSEHTKYCINSNNIMLAISHKCLHLSRQVVYYYYINNSSISILSRQCSVNSRQYAGMHVMCEI